mmetsp:Transcript_41236/g.71416  ORF Transcript_41236/g.71416 Transcript_41236/m.71416 type:complete len:313 (-) Transcript_41236:761-1699(-)
MGAILNTHLGIRTVRSVRQGMGIRLGVEMRTTRHTRGQVRNARTCATLGGFIGLGQGRNSMCRVVSCNRMCTVWSAIASTVVTVTIVTTGVREHTRERVDRGTAVAATVRWVAATSGAAVQHGCIQCAHIGVNTRITRHARVQIGVIHRVGRVVQTTIVVVQTPIEVSSLFTVCATQELHLLLHIRRTRVVQTRRHVRIRNVTIRKGSSVEHIRVLRELATLLGLQGTCRHCGRACPKRAVHLALVGRKARRRVHRITGGTATVRVACLATRLVARVAAEDGSRVRLGRSRGRAFLFAPSRQRLHECFVIQH